MMLRLASAMLLASVACADLGPSPREDTSAWLSKLEKTIKEKQTEISKLYGAPESKFSDGVKFYDAKKKQAPLVQRLFRALVLSGSFVVAVGGMSDVAGHGNMHADAYPQVMRDALKPVFDVARVDFDVRNMAMGGVPSFPNSVCMEDNFGSDLDVVMWDFRMVEHDGTKGELYLRQALMLPNAPFVAFKRDNAYLKGLTYAHEPAALHVIDEMPMYNFLHKSGNQALAPDNFCRGQCSCPGQVRWHAGWKMHRFRGLHWGMAYLSYLSEAIAMLREELGKGADLAKLASDTARWEAMVEKRAGTSMHKAQDKTLQTAKYASSTYRCAMTWTPKLGPELKDLVAAAPANAARGRRALGKLNALTKWEWSLGDQRVTDVTTKGHRDCNYVDARAMMMGNTGSGWIFFKLSDVGLDGSDGGEIAFCGDFPPEKKIADFALVLVNGEEVQNGHLTKWLESKTLGISSTCYSTTHNVFKGENDLGFRVMKDGHVVKLTHALWSSGSKGPRLGGHRRLEAPLNATSVPRAVFTNRTWA